MAFLGLSFQYAINRYIVGLSGLIRDGRIEEAINYIEEFFPQILSSDDGIMNTLKFALNCQVFVEMVARGATAQALSFAEGVLAPASSYDIECESQLQVFNLSN